VSKTTGVGLVVGVLTVLVFWFQREYQRGTFDVIERPFLSWLAANESSVKMLPPLTLVLYDEEASHTAGTPRMAMLDGALFARAASKLGAVMAGVEGLSGDPARLIQAADGMPVFAGYLAEQPPGLGWTPLEGEPAQSWLEVAGLAGRGGRFTRGFITTPVRLSGAHGIQLVARCGDRTVPSLLLVAWSTAQGWRMSELSVNRHSVAGPGGHIGLDPTGRAMFMPAGESSVITMNDLLVTAEKFEREGGVSPLRDRILVLARATPDVTRVTTEGAQAVTPMELWASAWEAVRTNRLFLPVGSWYNAALVVLGTFLAFSPACRSNRHALGVLVFATVIFLLFALAAYSGNRVMLPATPTLLTGVAGCVLGRFWQERQMANKAATS
jgi:hypothetical protein